MHKTKMVCRSLGFETIVRARIENCFFLSIPWQFRGVCVPNCSVLWRACIEVELYRYYGKGTSCNSACRGDINRCSFLLNYPVEDSEQEGCVNNGEAQEGLTGLLSIILLSSLDNHFCVNHSDRDIVDGRIWTYYFR